MDFSDNLYPYLPMRLICLLLSFLILMTFPVHAGHKPVQIFLRVNIQTAGDGMSDTQVTSIQLPPDGETIQIRTLPELTENDLIGLTPDTKTGGICLYFNHAGQVNLSAVTAQNQGRIMVVTIDGYVIYAPIIDEQITDGKLLIPHPLNPQVVQLLEEVVKQNVQDAKH